MGAKIQAFYVRFRKYTKWILPSKSLDSHYACAVIIETICKEVSEETITPCLMWQGIIRPRIWHGSRHVQFTSLFTEPRQKGKAVSLRSTFSFKKAAILEIWPNIKIPSEWYSYFGFERKEVRAGENSSVVVGGLWCTIYVTVTDMNTIECSRQRQDRLRRQARTLISTSTRNGSVSCSCLCRKWKMHLVALPSREKQVFPWVVRTVFSGLQNKKVHAL